MFLFCHRKQPRLGVDPRFLPQAQSDRVVGWYENIYKQILIPSKTLKYQSLTIALNLAKMPPQRVELQPQQLFVSKKNPPPIYHLHQTRVKICFLCQTLELANDNEARASKAAHFDRGPFKRLLDRYRRSSWYLSRSTTGIKFTLCPVVKSNYYSSQASRSWLIK